MGLIKLSKSNRNQARRETWGDPILRTGKKISPEDLLEHALCEFKSRGIEIKERRNKRGKFHISRNKRLWVLNGWHDKKDHWKAVDLMHELVHYRQRETFGPSWFEFRYISSAQFRVAMELPAYFEGAAALHAMGAEGDFIRRFIDGIPKYIRGYYIGTLNWGHTKKFIRKELNKRYVALP